MNCTQLKVWVKKYRMGSHSIHQKGNKSFKRTSTFYIFQYRRRTRLLKGTGGLLKKAVSNSVKGGKLGLHDKYAVIEELRDQHGVTRLLAIAEVSRANDYKWRGAQARRMDAHEHAMKEHMVAIHLAHPYFGYPRMQAALREAGYLVNHKKVWRLMKELSIQSVIRKKRSRAGSAPSVVYPNRLKRKFHATAPQQKPVTDITYISDGTRLYYLSAIQDFFNNEIVAWQI